MKKMKVLLLGAACAVSLAIGASAASVVQSIKAELRPDFKVVIDGKTQQFKTADGETVYPILYDGTTYLPVRAIGEMMGKTVYWYQDEKVIELKDSESLVTDVDVIINKNNKDMAVLTKGGVTLENAKQIALDKAGLTSDEVVFKEAKLDYDDGVQHYDIEFRKGSAEYSADIRVSDGKIISWEVENLTPDAEAGVKVTLEEAKKIALDKAGLTSDEVVFTEAKLDYDHGVQQYEIEFRKGSVEYSADIRVSDGVIISWEVENDKKQK